MSPLPLILSIFSMHAYKAASIRRNAGVHGLLQPLIYTNPIASAENQRPTTEWEEEKKEITAA